MSKLANIPADHHAELCALWHIVNGEQVMTSQLSQEDFNDHFLRSVFVALAECKCNLLDVETKLNNQYKWLEMISQSQYLGAPFQIIEKLRKVRAMREAESFRVVGEAQDYPDQFRKKGSDIGSLILSKRLSLDEMSEKIIKGVTVLPTGFPLIDHMCKGGIENGAVFVIASRPGVGKTTLAINIAKNVLSAGKTVYFGSLEMPEERILERLFQCFWKESPDNVRKHAQDMKRLPGDIIIDNPGYDLGRLISSMSLHLDADLFIVDYYQLIQLQGKEGYIQKLETISNRLKEFAFVHKKPLIVIAQLNRMIETDKMNREPSLSDLRGCGALEQDASVVTFLWDKNAKDESAKSVENTAASFSGAKFSGRDLKWIVRKNRNGENGIIDLDFTPSTMFFSQK